ncbi:Protein of unknown function (DUF3493) [Seminavis robusta]|uniref:Uncharacterized protein n=1 Tax=Seminavis robusta TaxID=568900 RepID=A0A9N8DFX6_9STRA|nr:Protein of unknown function (DUF3493) [Seminavis robusta]|eukprot:Sro73_g040520.1 Protein of unknown function (DUF3493) (343) ;mRNA; r:119252-120378
MILKRLLVAVLWGASASAFSPATSRTSAARIEVRSRTQTSSLSSSPNKDDGLGERFGGFTVKQRLREEVESPFRKVRFVFFLSTVGSALTALYFSGMSTVKALVGGYSDAPPLEQALQSDAINLTGAIVCGFLALREYNVGQANLQRIAKGGQLARLVVEPVGQKRQVLSDYRRAARVLIAAGGADYISELARSLNADQRADPNTIAAQLENSEVIVIPVLLKQQGNDKKIAVDNTREYWLDVESRGDEVDRNFDITRADSVVAFPRGNNAWTDYLESEIETASGQGFDVLEKGFTITVKKNGRILRRATGQPPWSDFLGAMEVLDGSKFGMPGDSERYGGP